MLRALGCSICNCFQIKLSTVAKYKLFPPMTTGDDFAKV